MTTKKITKDGKPGHLDPAKGFDPEDVANNRLFFRLVRTVNLYEREIQKYLGLSGIQGAILGELSRRQGRSIPLSDLVEYLGVSRQNLDAVLKRLEAVDYVERVEDENNRRVRLVRMTPVGYRVWNRQFKRSFAFYRHCTAGIGSDKKEVMTEALGSIQRALRVLPPELSGPAAARKTPGKTPRKRSSAKALAKGDTDI